MRKFNIFIVLLVVPLLAFTGMHKYYISVTQVNYIKEKESVQITTRVFIDDFEKVLQERYDENIVLTGKEETEGVDLYIERYLKDKLEVIINGDKMNLIFIGKEYDIDVMQCYIEIEGVKAINSIEVSNQVLFDVFEEQQNMIKTKINNKEKSFLLNQNHKTALLNFN
jgi:hypothetical protein